MKSLRHPETGNQPLERTRPFSGPALQQLMQAVLGRGALFRFHARGLSMTPTIRDGDILTLSPPQGRLPRCGDIVAARHPRTGSLVVHRVVKCRGNRCLLQGDASPQPDGWVSAERILGAVSRIERGGRYVRLGHGPERWVIGLLVGHGLLIRLLAPVRRIARKAAGRLTP